MENFPQILPEVIFSTSNKRESQIRSKLLEQGKIRKIAPRIYTSNLSDSPELIIRRNIFTVLSNLYPGSILSFRSAFEFQPTSNGNIYITYSYSKKIKYPGVTINFIKGPSALESDNKMFGELYIASPERKFLENLQPTRSYNTERRNLSIEELENKIFDIYVSQNVEGLNSLRDKARTASIKLGMQKEYEKLDKIIGSILATKKTKLTSPITIAASLGEPYDSRRLELFKILFLALKDLNTPARPDLNILETSYNNFAFFEAYFSNFIEGTEFTLDEAVRIIDTHIPIPAREEDSHDVIGTYDIVSRKDLMSVTPDSPDHLMDLLKQRHSVILANRPNKNPGIFKVKNNRAGDTIFVDYKLVTGTLKKGFEFYNILENPFAKAAYMMFMISEVHPFDDGNGRVARIMMNAELTRAGQSKIIIPIVYRIDYLINIKNLTKNYNTSGYIEMLDKAQRFSQTIHSENRSELQKLLEDSNAFKSGEEYILRFQK